MKDCSFGGCVQKAGRKLLITLHLKLDVDDPTSRNDVECTRWIVTCTCETVHRSIGVGFVRRRFNLILSLDTLILKCEPPYSRVLYTVLSYQLDGAIIINTILFNCVIYVYLCISQAYHPTHSTTRPHKSRGARNHRSRVTKKEELHDS